MSRYRETIRILYADNSFYVPMSEILLGLPLVLRPQHINSISEIEYVMGWDAPPARGGKEHKQWKRIWETLAAFGGLNNLSVDFIVTRRCSYEWALNEQWLFEEVKLVTQPQVFVLKLNWGSGGLPLDLPCTVLRPP